jgi:hypothetical protein
MDMRDRNGFSRNRPTFKVIVVDPFNRVLGLRELENVNDAGKLGVDFANFASGRPAAPNQAPQQQPPPTFIDKPGK